MNKWRTLERSCVWALFAAGLCLCMPSTGWSDPDLPGGLPNFEVVPAGSYVIPMDTNLQAVGVSVFNMKAYGLVNALLHGNVPVKWAIATDKFKEGMDFAADVRLLSPTNLVPANPVTINRRFYSGPFIVDPAYTNLARSIIATYGNKVAVYTVMSPVAVDIRYTLTHKPMVAVFDDGKTQAIHTGILDEAGFPASHYQVLHAASLGFIGATSCFTFASSPHFDGGESAGAQATSVREFAESGGNFLAQCAGVRTYENQTNGHFHTTSGFVDKNDATKFIYPNPDMAYNQYQGTLSDEGGSLQDWGLAPGSAFTNNTYLCVQNSAKTNSFRAAVSKHAGIALGGLVFYLGGHDYSGNTLIAINGRRMYLNAIFVPADRPGDCGITFTVDLELNKTASTLFSQVGSNVTFTVVVTNRGPGSATGVSVRDALPAGLSFTSASSGDYTPSNGLWNIGMLHRGASATLQINATVVQYGVMTNIAQVWTAMQGDPDSTPGNSVPTEDDQGQAVITVEEADLSLTKSVDKDFVHQGSNVTFTVAVTNQGFSHATGVAVRDALPPGVAYVSSSGGLYNPINGVWAIGALNAGSGTNLQITVTALALGTITNIAEVLTSNPPDPDSTPGNGNPTEDDYGTAAFTSTAPDYMLTKTLASPAGRPAAVGETVVFTISVTNTGYAALDTVRLDDTYNPGFLTFLDGTPPPLPAGGGSLTWSNAGPLVAGASLTVTARFTAVSSTLPGETTNTVVSAVTLANGVPVSSQTSWASVQLVVPGVRIAKSLSFPSFRPTAVGETNIFTMTVSNTGNYALDTVPVADTYDTGLLAFVGAEPPPADNVNDGTLNWANVGPLAPGASVTVTGRFSAVCGGTGTNLVVTVPTTANGVPVPPWTNGAPHTAAEAALLVTKRVVSPAGRPAAIGEPVEFAITVTNTGAVPVFTVPLTDTYNTNLLDFTSATPPEAGLAGGVLVWDNVGPLGVGGSVTVAARFNALTNGIGTNFVVTLTSANSVPHTNVNPRVGITKTLVSPAGRPAAAGEAVLFEITARNLGDVTLDVVPVTDTYDKTLLSFVSALPASVDTVNDGVIAWANVGPLTPGSGATITAHYTAKGSGIGTNVVVTVPSTTNGVPVLPATSGVPYAVVSPGVLLTKSVISPLNRPAMVGEETVFGLTLTNTGNIRLDTVPLSDTFDTNLLSVLSQTPPADSTDLPPGTLTWKNVGPLSAGEGVTVTARFTACASGSGVNVGVTSPATTNGVPVLPSTSSVPHSAVAVGIIVAKQLQSPAARPAVVGEEFVFTLLVANQSDVVLDTVPLTDSFDASLLEIVSQSPPANSTNLATGTLSWTNVGPVGHGGQVVVSTTFRAIASGTGTNVAVWAPSTTNALPIAPGTSSVPHTAVSPGYVINKTLISPANRPAAVGEPVSFMITVTNTGDIALAAVAVDDTYDMNILTFDSSSPQVSISFGNRLTWDHVGPLAVGGSTNLTVNFTSIGSTLPGVTTNVVISTVTESHGVPVGSQTNHATARVVAPAVALTKTLAFPTGRPAAVGETNIFTVTVSNAGDYPLDTVPVADMYDTSLLAFVGTEPPPADTANDGRLDWANVGPLAPGASVTVTGRFSVVRAGTGTNIVVTAPTTTNNVPVPSVTNGAPHTAADVSLLVSKRVVSPAGRPAAIGEPVEFVLAVTNTGSVPVFTVPLADLFDSNLLAFASAAPPPTDLTGGALTWANVGPLPVGGSATVTARFNALASGVGTNFAVTLAFTNSVTHTNVNPRVSINKTLSFPTGRPALVGETNIFTVTVSNTGDYPLDTVPVTDTYDTSLLVFMGAEPPPDDNADDGTLDWPNLGPLAPGGSVTVTGRFRAVHSGAGTNTVVTAPITTSGVPVPPSTNGAPHTAEDVVVFVSKRVANPAGRPAAVGEQFEFAITVTNSGAMPVFTVPLTDTFNTNLLGFASSQPPVSGQAGGMLTWANVGTLAAGESATVTTRFDVLASGVGTNRADTLFSASEAAHTNVNPRVSVIKALVFPLHRPAAYEETNVFTITVSNTGDYPLDTVPVEDIYCWDMLTYLYAEPPSDNDGDPYVDDGVINWSNVGPLAPGESVTITTRFSTAVSGTASNVVVTAPSTTDGVPVSPATNDVLHTTADPGVEIVKLLVSPPYGRAAQIGESIVFWIEVKNTGDMVLDTVPVTDDYDTMTLTYQNAVPPAEVNPVDGVVHWANVGPLEPGASTSLFLTFTARGGTSRPTALAFRGPLAAQATLEATNNVLAVPTTASGIPVAPGADTALYGIDGTVGMDSESDAWFTNVVSGTVLHTVSDRSTNHLLVVGISINNTAASWGMVTNVLYGNLALALAGSRTNDDKVVSIWFLPDPPVGTAEISASFDVAPGEGWVMGAVTFRNVDQIIPCGAFSSGAGASDNPALAGIPSAPGEMIVDTVALQCTSLTATGIGRTQCWSLNSEPVPLGGYASGGGSMKEGAGSVSMSWTATGNVGNWAMGALVIHPFLNSKAPSQTVLGSFPNPSAVGEPVIFTANVAGTGPAATGYVQFKIDGAAIGGVVGVTGGTAVSAAVSDLPVGVHAVTAVYYGDTNLNGSVASALTQTVGELPALVVTAISIRNGHALVEWPGTDTWSYTVLATPSLQPLVPWSNLLDYVGMPGSNGTMSATDTNLISGSRFYRIRLQ